MSFDVREQQANSRVLAAAEVLAAKFKIAVPDDLRSVAGGPVERGMKRSEAFAQFLENIVLEGVEPGLSAKAAGYTSIPMLRSSSDDDISGVVSLSKATVKKLRSALKLPSVLPGYGEPAPPMKEILVELSEGDDTDGDK